MNKFLISFVLSMAIISGNSFAADEKFSIKVLTPSAIKSLLGDFPQTGSTEEVADVKTLIAWQDKRTVEECEYADSQNSSNLTALFSDNNGPLTAEEASKLEKRTFKIYAEAGLSILLAKKLYNRARPYDAHSEVKPCIELETSTSFPSGHATIARFYANVLTEYFPARKAEFFKRADEAALNRVIGGVHYPSDIAAGKKLGDEIYKLLKND
jgi:acid phosphatase (class A)